MIEISLNKINKNYGFNSVLKDLSFDVKTNERVALIGSNGCGKTTTLRLILGEETPDSGLISIRKGSKIGYLTQIPGKEKEGVSAREVYLRGVSHILNLSKEIDEFTKIMTTSEKDINYLNKLQEEYRILGGYELNTKIEKIRNGFKLSNELLSVDYNNLSGGEKTIINLASLILSNPDILLLDEPTNHLDIDTLEWFEEYLNNYKGTVLLVSHDRYFMDKVVNKVICLEHGSEDVYIGNYSYYLEESEHRFLIQFQKYKNQQREIKAMKEAIARLKEWGTKSDNPIFFRRAASMEKRLEKMELIEKPEEKKELKLNFNLNYRSANHVLTIEKLNLSVPTKDLLLDASMSIYYQERVCLMGKNGTGKTTLIKNILNNTHDNIKIGANIKIGYIPQEIRFDDEDKTIYEHVRSFFIGDESKLRSKLSQFYFSEESITKKLNKLSGGEKVRLKLLELILKDSNFLILDEPTNHIDIDIREILEEALLNFDGTILFISHDRYFINKIATRIVRIEDKKFVSYDGNYDNIKKPVIEEKPKEKITIKASNRINEFVSDATSIEEIESNIDLKVYKIRKKSKMFYLKTANHLSSESIRLEYLQDKLLIPEKVFYEKYNNKSYILTKALKGESIKNIDPDIGINIVIDAFNAIYNIDYQDCIIDETIDVKIKRIEENLKNIKEIDKSLLNRFITKEGILNYLKGNKPKQLIGFTHGNLTLDNIYALDNTFTGLNNVIESGLSDIYYDIVTCEKSIEKYYGKEYVSIFYQKLGIEKDDNKSSYYSILNELKK